MGSRPEVNMFILHMTSANEQKWSKRNEKRHIVNAEFGPFAWCNRKQGSTEQQLEAQLEAYAELIRYVAKVSFLVWQINSRIHNILLVDLYYVYRNRKCKIRIGFFLGKLTTRVTGFVVTIKVPGIYFGFFPFYIGHQVVPVIAECHFYQKLKKFSVLNRLAY